MTSSPQPPIVETVRADIESMRTRGAGEIGKEAVRALARAAESYQGDDVEAFRRQLLEAAQELASARPTAVSLRNGLNTVLTPGMAADDVDDAKDAVRKAADAFAQRVDASRAAIADLAQSYLDDGDVVLTHCHSTVAGASIARAVEADKRLTVYATETRPFRQGLITVKNLAKLGVPSTLIVDSAAYHVMATTPVTKVVVGADTVAADGSLYNKVGTRAVALYAQVLGIPFYVAGESYKFSPYTLDGEDVPIEERDPAEIADPADLPDGVTVHNPVFDRTPPEFVTKYLTEEGPIEPKDTRAFVERVFGGIKRWI